MKKAVTSRQQRAKRQRYRVLQPGQNSQDRGQCHRCRTKLWDTENPNLYTVKTEVYVGDTLKDSYHSDFGFRWVNFTTEKGFYLNGKNTNCTECPCIMTRVLLDPKPGRRSVERQVQELKQMGVNAIRVTHNPASQVLIDVCNREGIMLVEEAFDCWLSRKSRKYRGLW